MMLRSRPAAKAPVRLRPAVRRYAIPVEWDAPRPGTDVDGFVAACMDERVLSYFKSRRAPGDGWEDAHAEFIAQALQHRWWERWDPERAPLTQFVNGYAFRFLLKRRSAVAARAFRHGGYSRATVAANPHLAAPTTGRAAEAAWGHRYRNRLSWGEVEALDAVLAANGSVRRAAGMLGMEEAALLNRLMRVRNRIARLGMKADLRRVGSR